MTDRSISLCVVENSTLIFKITNNAPMLFDIWQKHLKKYYPDCSFAADLEKLGNELKECFCGALEVLFHKNKTEQRKLPGWSVGFISGFIPSNISTLWCYEYVYKETNEYKELMFLKAIIEYFNFDIATVDKIEKLHAYLVDRKTDVYGQNHDVDSKILILEKFKPINHPNKEFLSSLTDYLESIIIEKHTIAFQKILDNNFCPDLDTFFTHEEIKSLINSYAEATGAA